MSLIFGQNTSNELQPAQMDSSNNLKVDIAGTSTGAITANVDVVGNTVGLATETKQDSIISELQDIYSETVPINAQTSSIDSKMSQGEQGTITGGTGGLQQVLLYGRDQTTDLHPIRITPQGDIDVEIAEYPKGQEVMADSFPVVIASDQSTINTSDSVAQGSLASIDTKITSGEDDSLTEAQQVLMYGRKDNSPTGLYAMKVSDAGALHVIPTFNFINNTVDTLATGAGGTATSSSANMLLFVHLTFFGSSTNTSDPIIVEVSNNNTDWYEASEYFVNTNPVGANVNYSVNIPNVAGRWWRLKQTDTLTTAFTLIVNASKK